MRRVRPTVKVLRELLADSFGDRSQANLIARNRWTELTISQIEHPLLADAERYFSQGLRPGQHRTSTAAAGKPVYEVRSRSGAAWRGAVILDGEGDPWLVHVDRHDEFNENAAGHLRAAQATSYMPSTVDYKLRAREEAVSAEVAWRAALLGDVVRGLQAAIEARDRRATLTLRGPGHGRDVCPIDIEVDHDVPAQGAAEAHTATSMVEVRLTLAHDVERRVERAFSQEVIPFLQPDPAQRDQAYGKGGDLHIWMTVTQAQLIQVLAAVAVDAGEATRARGSGAPTHLHYVASRVLMEAFVVGDAVRGVCGTWFVPTRDEHSASGLPVCLRCEAERPIAERLLGFLDDRAGE